MSERRDRSGGEQPEETERGEHNRLGYRNVEEERQHDEAGTQGPGAGEQPPDEQRSSNDRGE